MTPNKRHSATSQQNDAYSESWPQRKPDSESLLNELIEEVKILEDISADLKHGDTKTLSE
jgi:hypothetical protein